MTVSMSEGCSTRGSGGGPLLPPPLASSLGATLLGEGPRSSGKGHPQAWMSSSTNTNMEKAPPLRQQCTLEGPTGGSEGPSSTSETTANLKRTWE